MNGRKWRKRRYRQKPVLMPDVNKDLPWSDPEVGKKCLRILATAASAVFFRYARQRTEKTPAMADYGVNLRRHTTPLFLK